MAAQQFNLNHLLNFPSLVSLIIPYKRNNNNYGLQSRIDDLNDTLLELIFSRLVQWRYLATCKCVSKRWNSIISNPYFARYLTTKYSAFTLILGDRRRKNERITEHPYFQTHSLRLEFNNPNNDHSQNYIGLGQNNNPNNDHSKYYIVADHNDILIMCHYRNQTGLAYQIANPLTRQFIVVPITRAEPHPYHEYSFQSWRIGFAGFVNGVSTINVPNSKDSAMGFRIIRIIRLHSRLTWQIYYSETSKWKTYSVNDLGFDLRSRYLFDLLNEAVTLNNKVHWRGQSNKILVIDPFVDDKVSYCVLQLPSEIHDDSVLGSCRNQLRIAQFESNKFSPRIKVWEFDNYGDMINKAGSTMVKLRLIINFALKPRLKNLLPFSSDLRCKNEVICCHPNDPDIVYVIYNDELLQCDVVNNKLRLIRHCTCTWPDRYILVHPLIG